MRLDRDAIDRAPLDRDGIVATYILSADSIASVISTFSGYLNPEPSYSLSADTISLDIPDFCGEVYIIHQYALSADATSPAIPNSSIVIQMFNISPYLIYGSVKRNLQDKMFLGNFTIDKIHTQWGQVGNVIYLYTRFVFWIPDYTGTMNPVFVGMFPSHDTSPEPNSQTHQPALP